MKDTLVSLTCYTVKVIQANDRTNLFLDGHDSVSDTSTLVRLISTPDQQTQVELVLNHTDWGNTRKSIHPLGIFEVNVEERRIELGHGDGVIRIDFSSVLLSPDSQNLHMACSYDPNFGIEEGLLLTEMIAAHRTEDLVAPGAFAKHHRARDRHQYAVLFLSDPYGAVLGIQFTAFPATNRRLGLLWVGDMFDKKWGKGEVDWEVSDSGVKVYFHSAEAWWKSVEILADDQVEGFAAAKRMIKRIDGWL